MPKKQNATPMKSKLTIVRPANGNPGPPRTQPATGHTTNMCAPNIALVERKTLIGVLASHDDVKPNDDLASLFKFCYFRPETRRSLQGFHFVFTGGTHDRLFYGDSKLGFRPLPRDVAKWLERDCGKTRLPATRQGGVILLSYLITQKQCSIVWPFYAPNANHWQRIENQAFMRLCDQSHVKRLMNIGSVLTWAEYEAGTDAKRNLQLCPPRLQLKRTAGKDGDVEFLSFLAPRAKPLRGDEGVALSSQPKALADMTIALIAHDGMKARMVDFAADHEPELARFGTILATGTTGREVAAATSRTIEERMIRFHSGPKGGDIEIATMILYGLCDVVIFFVDPLNPHAHIDDIRVVFQACMESDQVLMITNEMHARDFMARTVRGNDALIRFDLKSVTPCVDVEPENALIVNR